MDEVGEEQVHIWRRSADVAPPKMDRDNKWHPRNDARYAGIPADALPDTEVREYIYPLAPVELR